MEMQYDSKCKCQKSENNYGYCIEYNRCSCKRCCHHDCTCSCSSHCRRCRKDLCNTSFKIRLAGLQGGLNFRLRQLLWCEAEFVFDNGSTAIGRIVSVGSNFVELLVDNSFQVEDGDEDLDKELSQNQALEEKDEAFETRHHAKGTTWIFSIDKIANIQLPSSNDPCTCH